MEARHIELHHQVRAKLRRLKKEAEQDGEYRVGKRIHAVLLNVDGYTSGDIEKILDVSRTRVSEWLRNYEELGIEGLLEGHRSGRVAKLTEDQRSQLGDIVESGPVAYGFMSGVWTSIMISQVIDDEFSVSYHPGHVRRMLDKMGFSLQRPKKLLAKANPDLQDRWRRYTYPNIKKKRRQQALK